MYCVFFLISFNQGFSKMSSKLILESISQKVVGLEDEYRTAMFLYFRYAVLLSRPSKDGFARLDGRLGKIARLTPVVL